MQPVRGTHDLLPDEYRRFAHVIDTARDVPTAQGRYTRTLDTTAFANGDYEIFVQATTPSGLKSHPSYGNEAHLWDAAQLSGAYYPIQIRIQN
jgi:hypothetical protein